MMISAICIAKSHFTLPPSISIPISSPTFAMLPPNGWMHTQQSGTQSPPPLPPLSLPLHHWPYTWTQIPCATCPMTLQYICPANTTLAHCLFCPSTQGGGNPCQLRFEVAAHCLSEEKPTPLSLCSNTSALSLTLTNHNFSSSSHPRQKIPPSSQSHW